MEFWDKYQDPLCFGAVLFHINMIAECPFHLLLLEMLLCHTFANVKLIV